MPSRLHSIPFVLLDKVSATGLGPVVAGLGSRASFTVRLAGLNGAVSAVVKLWASNDPDCRTSQTKVKPILLSTFTLSGTGSGLDTVIASDVCPVQVPYLYYWGEVVSISGNSTITTMMGAST